MSHVSTVMASNNNLFSASGIGIWRDLNRVIPIKTFAKENPAFIIKIGQSYISIRFNPAILWDSCGYSDYVYACNFVAPLPFKTIGGAADLKYFWRILLCSISSNKCNQDLKIIDKM